MTQVTSLLTRLDVSTRRWHAAVDAPWLDLARPGATVSAYVRVLVRTYGLIAPFESACRYTPRFDRVLDFRELTRAGLIAQDLLGLGLTPSQLASVDHCPSITTYRTTGEALGWLYVIERSTLAHDGVRRQLLRHLPEVARSSSYLGAHDRHLHGEHGSTYRRIVERAGAIPATATEIITAAQAACEVAVQWFAATTSHARSTDERARRDATRGR